MALSIPSVTTKTPVLAGRHSSVGIATGYGLDGPGIESRWGRDFPHPSRPTLCLLYNGYRFSFPGVKRLGRGFNHPLPSSAEVKESVDLYLCSSFGPSWYVTGRNLPHCLPEQHLDMKGFLRILLEHVSYRQAYIQLTQRECSNFITVIRTVVRFWPKLDYVDKV